MSEDGTDGSDVVNCGGGEDVVLLDRSDAIRGMTPTRNPCETVDDQMTPDTTITSGPSGPTNPNDPLHPLRWEFTSDEPWADFQCTVVDTLEDVSAPATSWDFCTSGHTISTPAEGTSKVFAVRAVDDQTNEDPTPDPRAFSVDTVAPGTAIDSGPSGGAVTTTSTPEFFFSSPDPSAGFLCRFDLGNFFECPNPFTAGPLSDGDHTLEVAAIDAAGNFDQTPASVSFRVATGGPGPSPGDGPAPNPQPAPVQQAKIIIGSLVLISGNAVKMSRKGRVPISLTCAGASKCSGRLSITTAEPVSKQEPQAGHARREEVHDRRQQEAQDQREFLQVEDAPRQAAEAIQGQGSDPRDRFARQPAHLDAYLHPPGTLSLSLGTRAGE